VKYWRIVLLLCSAAGAACAEEVVPQKRDFAWGMTLEMGAASPFYRLSLPLNVYTGVVRPDLGDLRVLNGQGAVVPQSLELPAVQQKADDSSAKAKLFPLYGSRETAIDAILIQSPKKWRDDRVSIATHERFNTTDEVLRGYILQLDDEPVRSAKQLNLTVCLRCDGIVQKMAKGWE